MRNNPPGKRAALQCGRARVSAEGERHLAKVRTLLLLQCGRARVSAEGRHTAEEQTHRHKASMWPRSGERGRYILPITPDCSDTASMWPRSGERGRAGRRRSDGQGTKLQCGRARGSAEGLAENDS